jgi:transcriptional regulator of met regulon
MLQKNFIDPYVAHGQRAAQMKKITVSIPRHVFRLLSAERTRRQVNDLRHATNSELLIEAFLHAFTGQPLPTDEELKMKAASKSTKTVKKATTVKAAAKPAAKKAPAKKAAAKKAPAKKAAAKKAPAKKAAAKKPAKKAAKK